MQEYLYLTGDELTRYILNSKDIKVLLTDEKLKEYLLKPENHYSTVWIIQKLNYENTIIFLNNEFLEKIIENDERAEDKYNAIMESKSYVFINANDKIIEYVLNRQNLYFLFKKFKLDAAEKLFGFIIDKQNDNLDVLRYFDSEVQEKLLTVENIEKLNKKPSFFNIFLSLSTSAIKVLMSYENYKEEIRNLNKEQLINFSEKIRNVDFSKFLLNDIAFIINIASLEDCNYYRNIINNLYVSNFEIAEKVEKIRIKFVKQQFDSIGKDGIFAYYKELRDYININSIDMNVYDKLPVELYRKSDFTDENLLNLTNKRKFEMLCDIYFKDYAMNVLYNLKQVLKYDEGKNIIPSHRKELYIKFLKFNELGVEEINLLVENMNKEDYCSLLYDDIVSCKNASYNSFNTEFIKLDKSNSIYNRELSNKNGIDIFCLEGEEFLACVHCGNFRRGFVNNRTISLSFIGTENIGVFREEDLILGFNYLTPEKIMHVYNSDSFTSNEYGSRRVNKIYDGHDLLRDTKYYNEILYSQKNGNNLTADYVVCMDIIDDRSLEYAKMNNIPILVINRKKYAINNSILEKENYQESYRVERSDYFAK